MVCIPCIVIPVLLWIFHKYIQPIILKFWNPWASKSVTAPPDAGGDTEFDAVSCTLLQWITCHQSTNEISYGHATVHCGIHIKHAMAQWAHCCSFSYLNWTRFYPSKYILPHLHSSNNRLPAMLLCKLFWAAVSFTVFHDIACSYNFITYLYFSLQFEKSNLGAVKHLLEVATL